MAEPSPPSSSVEAHEPELPRPQDRHSQRPDQALRSISSEVDIVISGPPGETPPTPPATTRASTAISGSAETDNEDDDETTVGVAIPVVEEPASEQVPAPERTPPSPPSPASIQTLGDVTKVDITSTSATPEEQSMPTFKTSQKRDTPERSSSSKQRTPPAPLPRPLSEFPPTPSTLSRVEEEGLLSPGLTISALPPSPPLTRRGTNSTRTTTSSRYGPRALAVLDRSPSTDKITTRPGTSSSSASVKDASVKDVSKLGKKLGKQPTDYLVSNGALSDTVSINFHPLQEPYSLKDSPGTDGPVAAIFRNLNVLIDSYLTVLSNGGSVAVANGYHSEARKLLEQVGGLFSRDLGVDGIGWSDILEYIRGGRDRPCLCVLPVKGLLSRRNIEATILSGTYADDDTMSHLQPSQFITKELAESVVAGVKQKTGKVEDWLEEVEKVLRRTAPPPSPTSLSSATEDDLDEHGEIVVQIIEGILNHNQISVFRSYLKDTRFLSSTKLALIRLYPQHTPAAITAPIIALYLLLHDELHPLLRAVSMLSDAEMELINSGRLDSFLDGSSNAIPRDDEEELATISQLDRTLWRTLEGLEDEIEELHNRALVVRRALKERKDGIAKKFKKRSLQQLVEGDIPIPLQLLGEAQDDENKLLLPPVEEWDGGRSILLGPDDSASNVTFNRRRRAERRIEKERLQESERKKLEKKVRKGEEGGRESKEPKEEKENLERRDKEREEKKEKEREGREGKEERREKRREKKEVEEEVEGEGTVVGSGKSVHKKERREKKDRREKNECDVDGCDECGSSVKRPRSRKREGEESEKLECVREVEESKGKHTHTHKSHKEPKEPEKSKEEKKEKEPKDKKGLLNSIGNWVDKKIATGDKPSKEEKKDKGGDRPATGASGKSAELREKERPATSHSHRDLHSHRERDYREAYRGGAHGDKVLEAMGDRQR